MNPADFPAASPAGRSLFSAILLPAILLSCLGAGTVTAQTNTVVEETIDDSESATGRSERPRSPETDYSRIINNHYGSGVSVEGNALALLYEAIGPRPEGVDQGDAFFQELGIARPAADGQYFQPFGKDMPAVDQQAALKEYDIALQRPWKADECPHVTEWLKANELPMSIVQKAVQRRQWYSPIVPRLNADGQSEGLIATLLPHIQMLRSLARYQICRANLAIANGKPDEAWADLISCHRLGRLTARGATLIDYLVGVAIDSMATHADLVLFSEGKLTKTQLQTCADDLRKLLPMPEMSQSIDITERLMFMDTVEMMAKGRGDVIEMAGLGNGEITPAHRIALALVDWSVVKQRGDEAYDQVVAAIRIPDRLERKAALEAIDDQISEHRSQLSPGGMLMEYLRNGTAQGALSSTVGDVAVALLIPAVMSVEAAQQRSRQLQANLYLAVALEQFRAANRTYPESLAELSSRWIAELPLDVFTDQQLRYKIEGNGYLLYSVGANGEDEGGLSFNDTPRGDDITIRIPVKYPEPGRN